MAVPTPEEVAEQLKAHGLVDEESTQEAVETEETVAENATVEEEEVVAESATTEDFSEAEQEAMAKGWKPDGPKSAEEFLRAEPLYEELKQRGKEIKTLKAQLEEVTKHIKSLKKAGYQERIDVIKAERAEAIARSDADSIEFLDEELHKVQEDMKREDKADEPNPVAVDFMNRYESVFNDYSLAAQEVKQFVFERDQQLAGYNLDPETHIMTLEKDMKTKFPSMFQTKEKKQTIPTVESDSTPVVSKTKRKAKFGFSDLSKEQKGIYKFMELKGIMSGEEYIKQLVDLGELK